MSGNEGKRVQDVTVKNMPTEEWNMAREAAKRLDVSMATWLARAIRQLAERGDGEIVQFPDTPGVTRSGSPAGVPQLPVPSFPFAEFAAAVHAAVELCQSAGAKPTRDLVSETQRVLVTQGRLSRGLPPPAPRKPPVPKKETSRERGVTDQTGVTGGVISRERGVTDQLEPIGADGLP